MKYYQKFIKLFLALIIVVQFYSCATYYQMNNDFQSKFQKGQFEQSLSFLENKKKGGKGKDRLLYYFDKGVVCNILGRHQLSNEYFTQADLYIEDFQRNYGYEMLAIISNPMVKPYKAEDFENVMIQYYKAKNYLALGDYSAALVEAKKLNEKLNQISDIHKKKITYKQDAFGHLLMGLVYDANKDYNNAFIAYRNAYNVYKDDYSKDYGVNAPEQLKKDILRTAAKTGLWDEIDFFEKQWNTKYVEEKHSGGEAVLFWQNGLGPVKSEWSINFTILPGQVGYVTFVNEEWGINLPFYVGNADERNRLVDLKIVRVAIPKFNERFSMYNRATINLAGKTGAFELAQDINKIAIQNLKDRMLRELGVALLRVALKQAAEITARKNDKDGLGMALSIFNAITEKADTRNWQTLPHDIFYTRINLPAGKHEFIVNTSGKRGNISKNGFVEIRNNQTTFHTINSVETTQVQ
jgi:hypothetical protein